MFSQKEQFSVTLEERLQLKGQLLPPRSMASPPGSCQQSAGPVAECPPWGRVHGSWASGTGNTSPRMCSSSKISLAFHKDF